MQVASLFRSGSIRVMRSTRLWVALAAALGVACVGSHFAGMQWGRMRYRAAGRIIHGQRDAVAVSGGQLIFFRTNYYRLGAAPPDRHWAREPVDFQTVGWFSLLPSSSGGVAGSMPTEGKDTISTFDVATIPLLPMAAACLIVPASRGWRSWIANRQQLRVGRCLFCGYDLRATPDRCPECGTVKS